MAGGGIKINNIKVSGGADGKTPIFKIEGENLYNSYDNGRTWNIIGKVVGANGQDGRDGVDGKDGVDGEKGATGAKLVSQVFYGKTPDGDNVYKQTFDDGTTTFWTAPKGDKGDKGDKGESFEEFTETVNDLKDENELLKEKIANNTAKLENLTNTLFENEQISVVEVSQAFVSRQTADGENIIDAQNVFPKLIKGSTVKSKNLIPYPYSFTETTQNGATYKQTADGGVTITATGGVTTRFSFEIGKIENLKAGTYQIVPPNIAGLGLFVDYYVGNSFKSSVWHTLTVTNEEALSGAKANVRISVPTTFTGSATYYPMLNEGETALPYQPYFPDLKRAYFDSIKSIGRNLFNEKLFETFPVIETTTYNGQSCYKMTPKGNIDIIMPVNIKKGETAWFSAYAATPNGADMYIQVVFKDGTTTNLLSITGVREDFEHVYRLPPNEKDEVVAIRFVTYSYNLFSPYYLKDIILSVGDERIPYEPYVEETYKVFDNLYLDEYDSFNPQTAELTRQTGWLSKATPFTEEELVGYDLPIVSADGLSVAYKLATPTVTKIEGVPKSYKVYNQGQEIVVQGEVDNSEYGAMCTITNDYLVKIGGENE